MITTEEILMTKICEERAMHGEENGSRRERDEWRFKRESCDGQSR